MWPGDQFAYQIVMGFTMTCPKRLSRVTCNIAEAIKGLSGYKEHIEWAFYQIRKIAGCACAWNAGNVFPATDFKGNRQLAFPACITARASRTCRDARRDRQPAVAGKTFPAFLAHAQTRNFAYPTRGPWQSRTTEWNLKPYTSMLFSGNEDRRDSSNEWLNVLAYKVHGFQVVSCGLFGAKPVAKPMLMYCIWGAWEHTSVKVYQNQ